MSRVLGLDIGGANLKAGHTDGTPCVRPFALWKQPAQLPAELADLIRESPDFDLLAVTMTGELCDCFTTKRVGVNHILDALAAAAPEANIHVWRLDASFATVDEIRLDPLSAAAANWLALATYAGRFAPSEAALLIDAGSTTADFVPLRAGQPIPQGRTDAARLNCGELVYTGGTRTPVCALLGGSVMAELFATMRDVYLVLEELSESADCDTADGRPADRAHAHARLARMLGGDAESSNTEETLSLARRAALVQQTLLRSAWLRVQQTFGGLPGKVILSGSGEFLIRRLLQSERFPEEHLFSLSNHLGPNASAAACAYAVAILAQEQLTS